MTSGSSNNMISRRQIIRGQQTEAAPQTTTKNTKTGLSSAATKTHNKATKLSSAIGSSVGSLQQTTTSGSSSSGQSAASGSGKVNLSRSGKVLSSSSSQNLLHHRHLNTSRQTANSKQQALIMNVNNKRSSNRLADELLCDDLDDEEEMIQLHNQDQGSSDGYIMNQYDDYMSHQQVTSSHQSNYWRPDSSVGHHTNQLLMNHHNQSRKQDAQEARQFDPYAIYNDDEDVWYSEDRLFEDHLEEIFNKWRLLDDDIWCKLIIMERNRRIGKAYARVPIVTIDGSHELSYDGYKLALNGFDNPDRDAKTEECRKRIGKGIRIKMDSFGNILIKRLSKSGIYVKEWLSPESGSSPLHNHHHNNHRHMPSRQQLIKNQNALLAAMSNQQTAGSNDKSVTLSSTSTSSGGSSMEQPNDSAVCDEVLNLGGQLEQDKIYVMFDMKKFQANITQELCRQHPDKRKLEQQCFSIVGLVRDADDIMDLPCWVMVINIVAIQILNERFPSSMVDDLSSSGVDLHYQQSSSTSASLYRRTKTNNQSAQPNFVSIFDQYNQQQVSNGKSNKLSGNQTANNNKEEDPYSLPANASSSDVKSSINDGYGTISTKQISNSSSILNDDNRRGFLQQQQQQTSRQFYGPSKRTSGPTNAATGEQLRHRSKSNHNLFNGRIGGQRSSHDRGNNMDRYNNSTSIYSPGHMLVPPPGGESILPPKLPPRDFGKSKSAASRSKSSGNVSGYDDPNNESIYSTGMILPISQQQPAADVASSKLRKVKKNRFLESLKAPLELATNRSSSAHRSASVIGAPLGTGNALGPMQNHLAASTDVLNCGDKIKSKSQKSSAAKNLKSFLGVKSSKAKQLQKQQQQQKQQLEMNSGSDDSNYVHLNASDGDQTSNSKQRAIKSKKLAGGNEECITQEAQSSSSYNDLDIPTPDYETDENAYALEIEADNYAPTRAGGKKQIQDPSTTTATNQARRSSVNNSILDRKHPSNNNNNNKEDLYYSGFRAHVPNDLVGPVLGKHDKMSSNLNNTTSTTNNNTNGERGSRRNSRFSSHTTAASESGKLMHMMMATSGAQSTSSKMSGSQSTNRDMIYGSTTHLQQQHQQQQQHYKIPVGGSRYRSASMQRYYPASSMARSRNGAGYADYDCENPYAMSQLLLDDVVADDGAIGLHTGTGSQYGYLTGNVHRPPSSNRRPSSRLQQLHGNNNLNRGIVNGGGGHYDVGRSSSGIYGNNSSSSNSSDYADWHPQMRKVNSGGYLNSIFKSHISSSPMLDAYSGGSQILSNNNNATHQQALNDPTNPMMADYKQHQLTASKKKITAQQQQQHHHQQQQHHQNQQQSYTSRTLKSGRQSANTGSNLSAVTTKQQSNANKQQSTGQNLVASSVVNSGPAYRSYDSSNDSEPSYTNSSDGLDIYDQIGANERISRHQFLDMQAAHNIIAPEVHVGEWENMYDR